MQKHVPVWPALFEGEVALVEGDRHRAAWSRLGTRLKSSDLLRDLSIWLPCTNLQFPGIVYQK